MPWPAPRDICPSRYSPGPVTWCAALRAYRLVSRGCRDLLSRTRHKGQRSTLLRRTSATGAGITRYVVPDAPLARIPDRRAEVRGGAWGCAWRVSPVPRRQQEGADRPPIRTSAGRHGRARHARWMGDAPVSLIAGGGIAGSGRYHVGFGARHQASMCPGYRRERSGAATRPRAICPWKSRERGMGSHSEQPHPVGDRSPRIGADILPHWSQPHPGGQAWPGRRCGPAWHQGTRHGGAEGARDPPVRTERGIARTDRRHRSLALAPPSGARASGSRVAGRCAPPHTRSRERLGACVRERSARVLA